ncbi:hypothetical protein [Marinicella meishanensis]|uniref:hypothetical protein n=1 Tax=Marinicella meishanensis TaxID=2873263 RepID=UPI001CBF2B79|nr:hypothetical protein [Marinicella sp. NBU2979]
MKIFLFIFLYLWSHEVLSQIDGQLAKDDWNEFQHCLKINNVEPIANKMKLIDFLADSEIRDEDQYLILIENSFTQDIRDILKVSIKKTASNISKLKNYSKDPVTLSWDMSYLFINYFKKSYSNRFDFKDCNKLNPNLSVFNYFYVFGETEKIIEKFKLKSDECCEKENCEKYLTFAYLMKMAVLQYEPKLAEYVSKDILLQWQNVNKKENLGIKEINYLDEILNQEW